MTASCHVFTDKSAKRLSQIGDALQCMHSICIRIWIKRSLDLKSKMRFLL